MTSQEPPRTYVVRSTTISGSADEARLQVDCEQGELELDIYWAVEQDLDRSGCVPDRRRPRGSSMSGPPVGAAGAMSSTSGRAAQTPPV